MAPWLRRLVSSLWPICSMGRPVVSITSAVLRYVVRGRERDVIVVIDCLRDAVIGTVGYPRWFLEDVDRPMWEEVFMGALTRPERSSLAPGVGPTPVADDVSGMFPTLVSFLVDDAYADGAVRERATIMLLADGGAWKVWVHDKDNNRSLWATGD